jgi:16S rRNA (guanine527-N7)-methyltransferase
MGDAEARDLVARVFDVPRETMARLDAFVAMLGQENKRQNLVSEPTMSVVWQRHILDSAQLIAWAPTPTASWVDIGSGAGFPGLVVSALHAGPVALVESRKLRVDFLHRAASVLGVGPRTEILASRIEGIAPRAFDVISARAFAPLPRLLALCSRFSTAKTRWILPKGRNARSELEAALSSWQGDFRIEPSRTDPEAGIIVAEGVKRKRG